MPSPYARELDEHGQIYFVNTKWGPSIGWFQVRALDDPFAWGIEDTVRVASELCDPKLNAHAAFVISKGGTDWLKWSVWKSGKYREFLGLDYELRTGHPRAGEWNI